MEYLNVPEYYQGYTTAVADFKNMIDSLTSDFNSRKIRLTTALLSEFLDFYVRHYVEIREHDNEFISINYDKNTCYWLFIKDGMIKDTMISESSVKKNKKKENLNKIQKPIKEGKNNDCRK